MENLLGEFGRPNITLELELTEGMVMHDCLEAARTMQALKGLGINLAIDDFGTGYSSLGYLRRFPFDIIKIDRSFVSELGLEVGAEAIVRAIIALAQSFKLGVIAEGMETLEQSSILVKEGCVMAQGFYYSHAVTGDDFRAMITSLVPR